MSEKQGQKHANKKGLGRGLGSLLGGSSEGAFSKSTPHQADIVEKVTSAMPSQKTAAIKEGFIDSQPEPLKENAEVVNRMPVVTQVPIEKRIWNIEIEKIIPNSDQPRQNFEAEPLKELAASIKEKGIIQPILVCPNSDGTYKLIAGERRWRAAGLAGLKEVPAILKEAPEQEILELALIENIQRENLNPIEEAEAYAHLIEKHKLTQVMLADRVGKDRVTIANLLRLLQLPAGLRQMITDGILSTGQAKVLLSVGDTGRQLELAKRARDEQLSVRALEKLAEKAKLESNPQPDRRDARTIAALNLEEELKKLLGAKIRLDYHAGKGRIVIPFTSDSELNQIADTLRDSWRN